MSGVAKHHHALTPRANVPSNDGSTEAVLFAVENVAAIEALDDSSYDDGVVVAMRSVLDNWRLVRSSALAANGITVANALSGGVWVRDDVHALEWRRRSTWYIDTNGNDENDGATALTALATHAELNRRLGCGPVLQDITVFIASNLREDVIIQAAPATPAITYSYRGTRTVTFTGTITAAVAYNPATGTPGEIEDTSIPVSWTASGLVNKLIVLTSGVAAGATAWIARDLGAQTARYSPFFLAFGTVDPSVGDEYNVVNLTEITGTVAVQIPFGTVTFSDLVANPAGAASLIVTGGGTVAPFYCDLRGVACVVTAGSSVDFVCSQIRPSSELNVDAGAVAYLDGCLCAGASSPTASAAGTLIVSLPSIAEETGIVVERGGFFSLLNDAWFGIFDTAGVAGLLVRIEGTASLADYLWGTTNTFSYGVRVDSCGSVVYNSAKPIDLQTPATADTQIGGTNTAYAALPYVEAARDAKIVEGQFV